MAKLNSNLLNSLLIDIREFSNFADEINSLIEGNDHLSWKYPHKLAKNVNVVEIIKRKRGTAGEMYISLLEIAYDRLHFVLELIVDFLSSAKGPRTLKKQKKSKGKFTSPAGTINKLLMQLKSQPSRVDVEGRDGDGMDLGVVGAITRGTQADSCLGCCENCSVVCLCLVELIRRTEDTFRDDKFISHVVQARESVKTRLAESTQWKVVTKLSEALTNDVEGIMKMWRAVRDENECLKREKRSVSLSLARAQRDLGIRDFELDEMRMRGDEMRREAIALGELNAALKHQLSLTSESKLGLLTTLASARKRIELCRVEIEMLNASAASLKQENQRMRKQLARLNIDGDSKSADGSQND